MPLQEIKKFNLDIPRMGYFVLVRKRDREWVGNAIYKTQLKAGFTPEHSRYTHIAVSGGGQWIVEISPPRSKVIDIRKKYKGRYVKIVRYRGEDYKKKRYKVAFWSATQSNLRYDWFGAIRFRIRWLFPHSKKRPFCSENALWSLQKEYFDALKIKPEKCLPAAFLNPKEFEDVWEGIIT